jgi:hypothetical protein
MPARMESASRTRLVALAVLLAAAVPLVVIAVSSGDGEAKPGGLRIERSPGDVAQITVYVEDPELNTADTASGAKRVTLECVDRAGKVAARSREAWPFSDTDQGALDAHVHVDVDPVALDQIARCRLRNTEPPLEGRLL